MRSLRFWQISRKSFGPPPPFFLLWHSALPSSPLQHRRPPFPAVPHHLLLPSPPRVVPQCERRSSFSSSGLPALAMPFSLPARAPAEQQLIATMANAGVSSLPSPSLSYRELLWFKPLPFISFSFAAHTPSIERHRRPLPQLWCHPVRRGQPTPVLPTPPQPPGKLSLTSLTLPSHSSWPDLHRNYLAVDPLLAGKLLPPSSLYLRPFSTQSDHPNSFPSSCCSYQTRAWPPSSPGSPPPTSSSAPPPQPPGEPHLRSSPL
jgi:hypothetical protein